MVTPETLTLTAEKEDPCLKKLSPVGRDSIVNIMELVDEAWKNEEAREVVLKVEYML